MIRATAGTAGSIAIAFGGATASTIGAVTVGAVFVLSLIGVALNAYPDWIVRLEAAREIVSKGRYRRRQRRIRAHEAGVSRGRRGPFRRRR